MVGLAFLAAASDCPRLKGTVKLVEAVLLLLLQKDGRHIEHATKVFCQLEPWKDGTVAFCVI
jgi:hypothetical protein